MRLAISSLGMLTAVGRDVVASCAAVRAGITCPSDLDALPVLDDDDEEPAILKGHAIRDYTEGFFFVGRWLRIAAGCLSDLLAHGNLPDGSDRAFWGQTALLLAAPVLDVQRFDLDAAPTPTELEDRYGQRLLALAGLPISPAHVRVFCAGQAAVAAALIEAADLLAGHTIERAIVLAVDSYLDPTTLDWLSDHNRLKVGQSPAGLAPGEAGAAFLIEADPAARRRGARIEALITGVAVGQEPAHRFSDQVNSGVGLAGVIGTLVPPSAPFRGDLITDLNGEEWRARELASARLRLPGRIDGAHFIHPAGSLGDTGAAGPAVAVCLAVRSFVRGYATSAETLVLMSSEHGYLGGLRVSRP